VGPGFTLNVTVDPAATFAVDTSNLGITNPAGFLDATDISDGQNVLVHVKSATPAAAGVLVNVLADRMVLRFSRLTGTVATISGNVFTIQNFQSFFGTPNVPPQVQTFVPQTTFDNVNGGNIGGLSVGDSVSIRALFLNPTKVSQPFLAATVRKH
jgi:branched-subunit amino acid ABC-type transport system permease component